MPSKSKSKSKNKKRVVQPPKYGKEATKVKKAAAKKNALSATTSLSDYTIPEDKHGRSIEITLPNGVRILRRDYARHRWQEGASRAEIARELSVIEGKPVRYQAVVAMTRDLEGGKRERGKMDVLVLNGPNLNMLGRREPEIYGRSTLLEIERLCKSTASSLNLELNFLQHNSEGELVEIVQKASIYYRSIVINAAAYSHTSIALLDALKMLDIPIIEVHLSNIFQRETFRHHSYVSTVAKGVICGFGPQSYVFGIHAAAKLLKEQS